MVLKMSIQTVGTLYADFIARAYGDDEVLVYGIDVSSTNATRKTYILDFLFSFFTDHVPDFIERRNECATKYIMFGHDEVEADVDEVMSILFGIKIPQDNLFDLAVRIYTENVDKMANYDYFEEFYEHFKCNCNLKMQQQRTLAKQKQYLLSAIDSIQTDQNIEPEYKNKVVAVSKDNNGILYLPNMDSELAELLTEIEGGSIDDILAAIGTHRIDEYLSKFWCSVQSIY